MVADIDNKIKENQESLKNAASDEEKIAIEAKIEKAKALKEKMETKIESKVEELDTKT